MKFKVGDKVEIIQACDDSTHVGEIYTLYLYDDDLYAGECCHQNYWKLIGGTMSKYNELKDRISNVMGWDKETDDILEEIYENLTSRGNEEDRNGYFVNIPIHAHGGGLSIVNYDGKRKFDCQYKTQCEKNDAFKQALMWLLDHSDIKDEKADKIAELQDRMEDLQTEINNLK